MKRILFFIFSTLCVVSLLCSANIQRHHATVAAKKRAAGGATIFYVDETAGNDANDGLTTGTAWQSMTKVETDATAGCTVKFKKGETWTVKGAVANTFLNISEDNITLDAYGSGDLPVFDLGNTVRNGVLQESSTTGLTVRFLRVTNGGGGTGALVNVGDGVGTVEDCQIDDHSADAGVAVAPGGTLTVRRCHIFTIFDDGVTAHASAVTGASISVYDCEIHDCGDGINNSSDGAVITTIIEDSWFYDNGKNDGNFDIAPLGTAGVATIKRTTFGKPGVNSSPKIVTATDETSIAFEACLVDATDVVSFNQPGISNGGGGACVMTWDACTFLGNPTTTSINFVCWPGSMTMRNCLFYYVYRVAYLDGGGEMHIDHACRYLVDTWVPTTNTNQVSTSDPMLVDPGNGDAHLSSTSSPAYHTGADLNITLDLDGVAFHATTPSVGCLEYVP